MSDRLLTLRQLAARLNIGYTKARELVAEGRIGFVWVGSRRRFPEEAIALYLRNNAGRPGQIGPHEIRRMP